MFDIGKKYYIYGAGDVAREVLYCLRRPPRNLKIEALIVSDVCPKRKKKIDGIPVISCDALKTDEEVQVIVAVLEKYRNEICEKLNCIGIRDPILMTFESDLWCEERGKTYALHREVFGMRPYVLLQDENSQITLGDTRRKSLLIYVAKSHMDKPLKTYIKNYEWERDIQVGAALTKTRICGLTDCVGDTISEKNKQYCELTALYWIWKNARSEYVGLCHYRRRFALKKEDVDRLTASHVDVVVTNPVVNVPDVWTMYKKNHISEDWEVMKDGVKKLCCEYLEALTYVERSNYYIPYNMFIMRREVLDQYCQWLFPLLAYCEAHCKSREDNYQNRYIGFLAERLMTIYLHHHEETLWIIFSKKHFYE